MVRELLRKGAVALCGLVLTASAIGGRKPPSRATDGKIRGSCFQGAAQNISGSVRPFLTTDSVDLRPGELEVTQSEWEADCLSADECFNLGERHLSILGDAQIAQAELERAVALGSVNPRALLDLASAYLYRYRPFSCGGLAKEEYCRAETVCRQAISLEGDTFEAYLLLGRILNGEVYWGYRDDDGGVAAAQKAISLDPNSPDGYCALTNSYRLLNRYEDALAAYEVEASIRTGNEPIGKPKLGRLHIEGWRSHELIDLQTAAEMCSAVHEYARALNYLDRAQKLVPDDEISYYWAGQIYLKLGDIDRARGEQEALAQICKRRSSECVGYARYLLDEIEQGSRQGTH